jgi:hypothetical protein
MNPGRFTNPVAPTTPLLSRAFVDSVPPLMAGDRWWAGPSGRRALPYLTQGVLLCGLPNLCEWPSSSRHCQVKHPPNALAASGSGRGPRTGAVEALANRTRATGRTHLVGSSELIQEQAKRLKTHSPTFASAAQRWGGSRSAEGL